MSKYSFWPLTNLDPTITGGEDKQKSQAFAPERARSEPTRAYSRHLDDLPVFAAVSILSLTSGGLKLTIKTYVLTYILITS
ncbi:Yersinia protein of uncharacterised function (DUF3831) [Yersinia ruckeri]|uniref:Yersinia protein of uncharacterized function (DUF3831) n=1 Tax=Yersinia ruckeri TaxID=29486 RepID=A0A380QL37_YERRU|nr:hypothetical protein UGYR_00725 [Yersinia ruckeri]CNI43926.1 Yersinia protein of uncharacterised function (DUF3831) [Yersinia ruckeri]SUP97265.1 Yersinia protein of uncharacterised function (DUF3831) [Yersinia ruckeri]SUP99332.1 Yersinia protein of uncharacterised function (DUF3831) [Yersinia ruckeri]